MLRYDRYILVAVLVFALYALSYGQVRGVYSQHYSNPYESNPAYAGFDFSLSVTSAYRKQWQDINGSPTSLYLGAHLPFYIWNGAIGVQVQSRSLGGLSLQSFDASYNYIFPIFRGFVSFGGRIGGLFSQLDGNVIRTPGGNYQSTLDHKDPLLDVAMMSGVGVQYTVGSYYFSKNIEAGFAIENIASSRIGFNLFELNNSMTYSALFRYKILASDNIKLKPSVTLYGNVHNIQLQGFLQAEYTGSIFGGVGVRGYSKNSLESLIFVLGTKVNSHIRVSYSYDFGVSDYSSIHSGSHEIVVNYNLNRPIGTGVPPKIIYNARNL